MCSSSQVYCRGEKKTKESLGEDKYLLIYIRYCPEIMISLPSSFFFCFRGRKGHYLAHVGSKLWNAWYTPR